MLDIAKLENIAKENGKSFSFLSEKVLGKYRTFLKDVKANRAKISDEQISALANALDTTPAYLKGESDIKEKAAPVSGSDLSDKEIEFLKAVDLLNPVMQRLLLAGSVLDAEDLERLADLAESLAKAKAH